MSHSNNGEVGTSVLDRSGVKALYFQKPGRFLRWWSQSWLRRLTDWMLDGLARRLFGAMGTTNF